MKDGDSRAIFKDFGTLDMRQFDKLRMFIHAESVPNSDPVQNGEVRAIIRFGTDFTNNYYEYQIPLEITPDFANNRDIVWPEQNRMQIDLKKTGSAQARKKRCRTSHPHSVFYDG
ncbi:MAG: hypothetical protein KL787_08810 [Taibaiella sp.]|nr:hypothetical protein [Taibaiella sp.]